MIARSIFIEGHVQGVFFREWTIERAREIGVSGWVRNLTDGRVEVYVVGEAAAVGRFVDRLRVGSPASQVSQVHVADADIERLDGFTRRQSV
ncbi:acylphosphatase [Novosphingobium sp. G106]|nr:acylphosphatase [Novosphingobium sp. G106]